jgi:hypothetical protein
MARSDPAAERRAKNLVGSDSFKGLVPLRILLVVTLAIGTIGGSAPVIARF